MIGSTAKPCFECGEQVVEPLFQNEKQDGTLCEQCCKNENN